MKTLIIFLISLTTYAQVYTSLSFDVNKAILHIDNPRTETDWKGLDYDVEVGYMADERDGNIGIYLYYGAFPNAFYTNHGFGVDWYITLSERFKISIGNYYSTVKRHKEYKYLGSSIAYFNPRGKISYDTSWITIELIAKLQSRGDIGKAIPEGQIGLTKKFN